MVILAEAPHAIHCKSGLQLILSRSPLYSLRIMSSTREPAIFDAQNPASPLSVASKHTALLLMDYHSIFVMRGGEEAAAAVAKAQSMREWATAHGILVVHCLVDLQQDTFPSSKSASRLKAMRAMLESSPTAADEYAAVAFDASADDERMVTRRPGYFSALKSRELGPLLGARRIASLILCGVSTSGCVLSTARAAGDEEYVVTVIEDACMDPTPGLHDTLVKSVLLSQAHVAMAGDFQEQWKNAKVKDS